MHLSFHIWSCHQEGCEIVVCGIKCAFDLHLDWVALQIDMDNALNYVSRKVMFQEL
jgi:hypothetical protein